MRGLAMAMQAMTVSNTMNMIGAQDTLAIYMANCKGVKAAPPARAAAKSAAPAMGEPDMCYPTLANPIHVFSNHIIYHQQ